MDLRGAVRVSLLALVGSGIVTGGTALAHHFEPDSSWLACVGGMAGSVLILVLTFLAAKHDRLGWATIGVLATLAGPFVMHYIGDAHWVTSILFAPVGGVMLIYALAVAFE